MTDYTWRPKGMKVKIQAVSVEPLLALKLFVLPAMNNPDWIENSKPVTDTGLSSREWLGLVIHAISLMDKTDEEFLVAKEDTGGDGALVRNNAGSNEAVLVEQTLATHKESDDLLATVEKRVQAKSAKGESYAANKHLVVLCNINGDLQEKVLARIVSEGWFNIVNVIGFHEDGNGRHFLSLVFDKDIPTEPIHRCAIDERKLRQAAIDSPLPISNKA